MKLYHVSYNKVDRFIPRVPKERAEGENDDIPRICFSDSIEKCIAAKPSGPTALEIAEEEGIPVCLYVYSINTEDYDKRDLFDPTEVFLWGVPDARITHEWWLLCEPDAISESVIEVISFDVHLHPTSGNPIVEHLRYLPADPKRMILGDLLTAKARREDGFEDITFDRILLNVGSEIGRLYRKSLQYTIREENNEIFRRAETSRTGR